MYPFSLYTRVYLGETRPCRGRTCCPHARQVSCRLDMMRTMASRRSAALQRAAQWQCIGPPWNTPSKKKLCGR